MKRLIKLLILNMLLLLVVFMPISGFAEDMEDTVFLDFSQNQHDYGACVAMLNALAMEPQSDDVQAAGVHGLYAVLTRTDGRTVDFSKWQPLYVIAGPYNCYTLYFDDFDSADTAVSGLTKLSGIRYAEHDDFVYASAADSYSYRSWGATELHYAEYESYISQWGQDSVMVAIVDSGVSPHSLITPRIQDFGYDYVDADSDPTNDEYGHGTHVAGILADATQSLPVYVYPVRVLDGSGRGTASNVANGIRSATERGVSIINLSLEMSKISKTLDDAIIDALNTGIIVVVAAGNHSLDTANISPAHLTNLGVLVVGSVELDGSLASYSNFGNSVDIYAYGSGIVCASNSGGYSSSTGTSMSAPHISALAAMVKLLHPELGPADVENRITYAADYSTAYPTPSVLKMIPQRLGFSLTTLQMSPQELITLPVSAFPSTANERIRYASSDENVLTIDNGTLLAQAEGTAELTVACMGFAPFSVAVTVRGETDCVLELPEYTDMIGANAFAMVNQAEVVILPSGMTSIGSGAFQNCSSLRRVYMPDSIAEIGENDFSGAVLFCAPGSDAESYAIQNGCAYLSMSPFLASGFASTEADENFTYTVCDNQITITKYLGNASEVTLPGIIDGLYVTALADSCFEGCTQLNSVYLSNRIRTIGSSCFLGCNNLSRMRSYIPICTHAEEICEAVEATCIADGRTAGTHCSICGVILSGMEIIPAAGHTEEVVPGTEPTCTQTGLTEGKICSVCEEILAEQEIILARGHTEEVVPGTEPTCTQTGLTEGKICSVCEEILAEQEILPAAGHTEEVVPGTEPTCTQSGITEGKVCSVCNETITEQEIIPATGHTEVLDEAVAPTCCATGRTAGSHCLVCGEVLIEQSEIPMTEHEYVRSPSIPATQDCDGSIGAVKCRNCDAIIEEETVILCSRMIILPAQMQSIESEAFAGIAAQQIVIPDGCKSIGSRAFAECKELLLVVIPDSVIRVEPDAFEDCGEIVFICSADAPCFAILSSIGIVE